MNDLDGAAAQPAPSGTAVCAIGASAGGVGALQALFGHLPNDLGLAYVVVLHLLPDHPSALHEILATRTRMPVAQVQDRATIEADTVYVIPPGRELLIDGETIVARPFEDALAQRMPIDGLLRSVAANRPDAIAVILSGAGADGTVGVGAVKEAGGIVLVQEPDEAGFSGMPHSAVETGAADFVAPIEAIVDHIARIARGREETAGLDADDHDADIRRVLAVLRQGTGHDFAGYKRATVLRRIARRMQILHVGKLPDYLALLRRTPGEADALLEDLLISVTMFFRDPAAFDALRRRAIRPLLEGLGADAEIRAWVVGCATGEEAYSVAILLVEEAERLKIRVPIQIFATDLDERALATAREGRYSRAIEAQVSPERLRRFFVHDGVDYRVVQEVRERVLFAVHSVVREPPFTRLDLVSCRNVLIYMDRSLQQQTCGVFHYALRPDRYLFLGSAETVDGAPGLFNVLDREARLYRSRPISATMLPSMPNLPFRGRGSGLTAIPQSPAARGDAAGAFGAAHAAALESSAAPSVLTDAEHAVLHLSPTAGRFFLLPAGPLSAKLPSIVRPELRLGLLVALERALKDRQPTLTRPVAVDFERTRRGVALHVIPVPVAAGGAARVLVCFLDDGPLGGNETEGSEAPADAGESRRLHAELATAQERIVTMRHENESVVQDLRAANEELQSLNEEYRSTAEELETSKEELQSINEELQTVNAELKAKLDVIQEAHADLQNLTASSGIGTLFLDGDLRIRMFTPPAAKLFSISGVDIGRPLTDLTHKLAYDGLERDIRGVLGGLDPVETEVGGRDECWYLMRVQPYRSAENRTVGVVITFDDISGRLRAEVGLRESEARLRAIVTTIADAVFRMSADWSVLLGAEGHTFLADTTAPAGAWLETYFEPSDRPCVRERIDEATRVGEMFEVEHRIRRIDGGVGRVRTRAVPIRDEAGAIVEWVGTLSDLTGPDREAPPADAPSA